jgi:hypothetical protein
MAVASHPLCALIFCISPYFTLTWDDWADDFPHLSLGLADALMLSQAASEVLHEAMEQVAPRRSAEHSGSSGHPVGPVAIPWTFPKFRPQK